MYFFFLGLCFGSFANVVIFRVPLGKSVVKPNSACPNCNHKIRWFENIPILSYIFLRAKCSGCKIKISLRYPFVELIMGLLFMGAFYYLGFSFYLVEILIFFFGLVCITFIDFDHMIIPDIFSLSGIVLGLIGAALNPERLFQDALFGVLVGFGFFYFVAWLFAYIVKKDGLGGGDIKLLAWIGAVLGLKSIFFVIFASSWLGILLGVSFLLIKRKSLKTKIPFGPYIALAAVLFFFFQYWFPQISSLFLGGASQI